MVSLNYRILILAAIGMVLAATPAFAASVNYNQTILNASYQYANCKTNFTVGLLSQVSTDAPSLSGQLGNFSTAITQDTAQLQSYAASDNLNGFRTYVSGTFDPELKSIDTALKGDYQTANLSASTIASLRQYYNTSKLSYMNCALNALKNYGNQKVSLYYSLIGNYENISGRFSSYGINTSSITSMLQNGTAQVIVPLQNQVNNADTAPQLFQALQSYCLFNGCANGTNFHLDAKVYEQGLTLIYNKLSSVNILNGTLLQEMHTDIDNVSSTLNTVGSSAYTGNQESYIFNQLTGAISVAKSIISHLR